MTVSRTLEAFRVGGAGAVGVAKRLYRNAIFRRTSAILLSVALIFGAYIGYLQLSGNFHPVVNGEFYRSAQVSPEDIIRYQKEYGIRTIVNLRGDNTGKPWYDQEIETARAQGIVHYDFRMSASRILPQERAAELLALLRDAPKPILIHCKSGSDRTGLVTALYVSAIAGGTEEEAERALSLRYGHIGIPYISAAYPMQQTWEALEPWLGINGS